MDPIIRCENIYYTYPESTHQILNGINLSIEKGSFTVISGQNAGGKSTLAKHFNGICIPTSGRVTVNGMDTRDENNLLCIRQTVGMVFQNPDNQIVSGIVEEDVAFAPENLGIPPQEIQKRVDEALTWVGMTEFRNHAPHLLSGGQKQRIAIAGIIAMRPSCIVLDEPTAMLDPEGRREVMDTLHRLNRENGITIVLITHHMEEALGASRLIVLAGGRIVTDGIPEEVLIKADMLNTWGITAPDTALLISALNKAGFSIPANSLTPEACAEAIIKEMSALH